MDAENLLVVDERNERAMNAILALLAGSHRKAPRWASFWATFPKALLVLGDTVDFGKAPDEVSLALGAVMNNAHARDYCLIPEMHLNRCLLITMERGERSRILKGLKREELELYKRVAETWWSAYLELDNKMRGGA